jgi:uroporphyrinogen decarboxylase
VRRRVSDLGPGGGFVFTPVHNIQPNVPAANVVAAFDEARRFGRYPISSRGIA